MSEYIQGQLVRLSCVFRDAAAAPADPTEVTFKHRPASIADAEATVKTYPPGESGGIVRDGIGQYHVDVSMDEPGEHWWRWESTGAAQAADQGLFVVLPALL
ncbi:hypothetical protein [Methyloversatilis discipulorum]|uniref:hypothetical protein n=1 Tax=Methyloversatilis discipulorum TaxID=1119528 RepID=UPI003137A633